MTRLFLVFTALLILSACIIKPIVLTKPNQFNPVRTIENPIATSKIDSLLKEHNVNGVSISYINDRFNSWTKGYGHSDNEKAILVNQSTQFQAAEISQTIATIAIFSLIQADKISLDTDLSSYIQEFKIQNNYSDYFIALRNLLKHRGGFNISNFDPYNRYDSIPSSEQILNGIAPANNEPIQIIYEPLNTLKYSEGGYHFVQMIIEKLMRESYSSYVANNIFYPFKMNNSSFINPIDTTTASFGFNARGEMVSNKWKTYPQSAASGLWTSSEDLAIILQEMISASNGKSRYIEIDSFNEMLENRLSVNYDYDKKTFSFVGQNEGFTSYFSASKESKKAIVIMTNSANGGALINDILTLCETN